jgi:hypothetical protein
MSKLSRECRKQCLPLTREGERITAVLVHVVDGVFAFLTHAVRTMVVGVPGEIGVYAPLHASTCERRLDSSLRLLNEYTRTSSFFQAA